MADLIHWRRLVASEHGPDSSTTRLLLLTMSLHMDQSGGSCFPSTKTLSVETGLSERVVCHHLAIAEGAGWVESSSAGMGGKGWKRNQYQAATPKALTQSQHIPIEGTDAESAPYQQGTDFGDIKALTQSQSSYPIELSSNKQHTFILKDQSQFIVDDQSLQILNTAYPGLNVEAELQKLSAWSFANPNKRKTRSGAMRFVNGWMARASKNGGSPQPAPSALRRDKL